MASLDSGFPKQLEKILSGEPIPLINKELGY